MAELVFSLKAPFSRRLENLKIIPEGGLHDPEDLPTSDELLLEELSCVDGYAGILAVLKVYSQCVGTGLESLVEPGETLAADRRWKGDHDCKTYLASYSEALVNAGLSIQLSIRFWTDVPKKTKDRRKLEQKLIQQWLPPFNKETRTRWTTPFTSDCN